MINEITSDNGIHNNYKVGDVCVRTDNRIEEDEPQVFTTHKVDMDWGVVYYYKFNGIEESIGIASIKPLTPKRNEKETKIIR